MGHAVNHGKKIILNRCKFKEIIKEKNEDFDEKYNVKELHDRIVSKWNLSLKYKSFLNLTENRVTWSLLYAYAVAKELDMHIDDLFVVENDTNDEKGS